MGVVISIAGLIFAIVILMQPAANRPYPRCIYYRCCLDLVIGVLSLFLSSTASLIIYCQEVRPILTATNETVNNLRGTVEFLGENVVEPVIKLNGYLAGMSRVIELMGIKKK
jgi:hypothetical protein